MIELKRTPRGELLGGKVVELIQKRGAASRVLIASFDDTLLWKVYNRDPSLPLLGLVDDEDSLQRMLLLPIAVIGAKADMATHVLETVPAGVAVWTWTVFDVKMAEELALLGVHGLISDVPQKLVEVLRRMPDLIIKPGEGD